MRPCGPATLYVGEVVLGVAVVGQGRDAVAHRQSLDTVAERIQHSPTLMAERARRGGEGHHSGPDQGTTLEAHTPQPSSRMRT
jgi:hypothetical protein